MERILAVDYGKFRTGIAVSDPLNIIASGLDTIPTQQVIEYIKNYTIKENVGLIIVGEAKDKNNEHYEIEFFIKKFLEKLSVSIPNIPIKRFDERYTSIIAKKAMTEAKVKRSKIKQKLLVNTISATLILQSYLQYSQRKS